METGDLKPTGYAFDHDGVHCTFVQLPGQKWAARLSSDLCSRTVETLPTDTVEETKAAALALFPDYKRYGELFVELDHLTQKLWPKG